MPFYPAPLVWEEQHQPALSLSQLRVVSFVPSAVLLPGLDGLRLRRGGLTWTVALLLAKVKELLPEAATGTNLCPLQHPWLATANQESLPVCLPGRLDGQQGVCQHRDGYFLLNVGQREGAGGQRSTTATQRLGLHRFLCHWRWGAPPDAGRWMATHRCGHADCLCPEHLVWASVSDNAVSREYHKGEGARGWKRLHDPPVG